MPRQIRILSIITRVKTGGGAERRLIDVLRALPEADHTVVVGRDSDREAMDVLAAQAEVLQSPNLVRSLDPWSDLRAVLELRRLIRRGGYDVVHTHHAKSGVVGRVAARAAGVSIVYHSASGASFGPSYGRVEGQVQALAERLTAPMVSRYFVVGHDLAARLADNGISRRRLEVLRSSMDLGTFHHDSGPGWLARRAAWRDAVGIGLDELVVCYVGRLDELKGVGGLPELVARASRERGSDRRPVTLVLAGTGPLEQQLRQEIEVLAAAPVNGHAPFRALLLGHVANVPEVMAGSDLLVVPSPKEGLPQILVQAAASGLPFVAYDIDGVGEVLAMGATGQVVALRDEPAFQAAITERLRASGSESTRVAPDPSMWIEWDPAVVASRYRSRYQQDLGLVRLGAGTSGGGTPAACPPRRPAGRPGGS